MDFGDGSTNITKVSAGQIARHDYAAPGPYTVSVIDQEGAGLTTTKNVVVPDILRPQDLRAMPGAAGVTLLWDHCRPARIWYGDTSGLVTDYRRPWDVVAGPVVADPAQIVPGITGATASTRFGDGTNTFGKGFWGSKLAPPNGALREPYWVRTYLKISAAVPSTTYPILADNSLGSTLQLFNIVTSGAVQAYYPGKAAVTVPGLTMPYGKWVRAEIGVGVPGPTKISYRVAVGDDPNATAGLVQATVDVGADLFAIDQQTVCFTNQNKGAAPALWQDFWAVDTRGWIGPATVEPPVTPVPAPAALTPLAGSISAGYRVWRKETGGEWAVIGTTDDLYKRTYIDATAVSGTAYTYRVTAVADSKETVPSNDFAFTAP